MFTVLSKFIIRMVPLEEWKDVLLVGFSIYLKCIEVINKPVLPISYKIT